MVVALEATAQRSSETLLRLRTCEARKGSRGTFFSLFEMRVSGCQKL